MVVCVPAYMLAAGMVNAQQKSASTPKTQSASAEALDESADRIRGALRAAGHTAAG